MTEPPAKRPRGRVVLRFFIAHGLSYPIATAWAFASVPALVVGIASRVGTTLDDAVIAHKVLIGVAWPAAAAFVLVHAAGIVWGLDPDETRGRRRFVVAMAVLSVLPVVGGGHEAFQHAGVALQFLDTGVAVGGGGWHRVVLSARGAGGAAAHGASPENCFPVVFPSITS